jgi:hypothetical protein
LRERIAAVRGEAALERGREGVVVAGGDVDLVANLVDRRRATPDGVAGEVVAGCRRRERRRHVRLPDLRAGRDIDRDHAAAERAARVAELRRRLLE